MTPPLRDVALCVELGYRPVRALMQLEDWEQQVDRVLSLPPYAPEPS